MLQKNCLENEKRWGEGIPFVLFAACELVQESFGFSPAKLVFGHTVHGLLKALQEKFLSSELSPVTNVLDYISQFQERLHHARSLAKEALARSQTIMKSHNVRSAVPCQFQVGDKILVLLLIPSSA